MSFYFVAFIHKVIDPVGLQEYARLGGESLKKCNAVRLAAGLSDSAAVEEVNKQPGVIPIATCQSIEGLPVAGISVIKFSDRASFEQWYYSPEYQRAVKVRQAAAITQIVISEGV